MCLRDIDCYHINQMSYLIFPQLFCTLYCDYQICTYSLQDYLVSNYMPQNLQMWVPH